MNSIYRHKDDRRELIEWIEDTPFCAAKVVISCSSTEMIGDHYHNNKNEMFLLLTGMALEVIIGNQKQYNVIAPIKWEIPKSVYHSFRLSKGSILLGVADKKFDPNDEIKL